MGVDAICHVFIFQIAHCNRTEWVRNLFMCDIAHTTASLAEEIALCERYHWRPHNPFSASQTQRKSAPCERALIQHVRFRTHRSTGTTGPSVVECLTIKHRQEYKG